jgi:hypothetical protein
LKDGLMKVMGLMLEVKTGWDGIRQDYLESVHGTRPETDESAPGRLSSSVSA